MALDFLAGCLGGCAGVLVGHPFDTVKVHLQTQNARNPQYRNTLDCFKQIIAKNSVRGLYSGMSSPMAGVAFVNAIVFGVYGNVQRNIDDPDSIKSHFIAGSMAGLVQSSVCTPMELAKTRLQLQSNYSGGVKFDGPLHCLNSIWKTEGFRGVFRGLGITACRDVPGFASYFVAYELLIRNSPSTSAFYTLMAGGLAGTVSWLLTFPIDVIKSSIQADGMSGHRKYNGVLDCIEKGYKSEGYKFYCRGLTSTLLRAFPMNAACFLVVSWVMKLTDKINFDVEIRSGAPLAMVPPSSAKSYHSHFNMYHMNSSNSELLNRKFHFLKSLIFLGAFSEAVCASEIIEMTENLCNRNMENSASTYESFETLNLIEDHFKKKM